MVFGKLSVLNNKVIKMGLHTYIFILSSLLPFDPNMQPLFWEV